MTITLGVWGNNLALRLPSHVVKEANLRAGTTMTVRLLDNGDLRVRAAGDNARRRAASEEEPVAEPVPQTAQRGLAKW